MSIERKISPLERTLLITPIKKYLDQTFNVEVTVNDTIDLKPPYLILGNHVTNWDPLIINSFVEEPISFVAASQVFKNPLLAKVLHYVGAISKTKNRADSSTIRNIMKAKKANRVIGIFPEGNRTWNGETENITLATAKLVRSLKIPVVIATIHGGYLSHPRWAQSKRKGKVTLALKQLWDSDELKQLDLEQIHQALENALYVNDFTWQQQTQIEFTGKNLANYLERYLFTCPSCHEIGQMHSDGDLFHCKHCNYTVRYNTNGLFTAVKKELVFENIIEWNNWQIECLKQQLVQQQPLQLPSETVEVATTINKHYTKLEGTYLVQFEQNAITLTPSIGGNVLSFPIASIASANAHMHHKIEFVMDEQFYHVKFLNERAAAYAWYQLITHFKRN